MISVIVPLTSRTENVLQGIPHLPFHTCNGFPFNTEADTEAICFRIPPPAVMIQICYERFNLGNCPSYSTITSYVRFSVNFLTLLRVYSS
jgi:hypothetical protein